MFYIRACKGLARAQALGQKSLGLQALKSPGFWKALKWSKNHLENGHFLKIHQKLAIFSSTFEPLKAVETAQSFFSMQSLDLRTQQKRNHAKIFSLWGRVSPQRVPS